MISPDAKIAVIGLGYVGLPLAVEFGKYRQTIGFDIDASRILELQTGHDRTREVDKDELTGIGQLSFSASIEDLQTVNVFVVTVPTPIDAHNRPDLTPLLSASRTVGQVLKKGDIVIYESTVYPGATEEDCVPVLEDISGLTFNRDFFCGYSPERINPGDKTHRLPTITKVTSGSTPEVADAVDELYSQIITAGTHKAASIRVAEAAKVIENTQRDLNIALINELSMIFNRLGIDTESVLEAAGTKWNFLPFRPGLVGGHCIGVDPYYLTHKAEEIGFHPQVILAGRRINDGMGTHVAVQMVKAMIQRSIQVNSSKVLVLGLTFKENCPDLRNTRVISVIEELSGYGIAVDLYDPWVNARAVESEYPEGGFSYVEALEDGTYDGVILAVQHREFQDMGAE
ncbi:MAG: nucleotide sugar dehydrogenase, partial [Paracoccaceae bacterium]